MRAIRDHDHNVQRCSDKKFAGHKNKEKCATRKHERAVRKGKRVARNAGRGENKLWRTPHTRIPTELTRNACPDEPPVEAG